MFWGGDTSLRPKRMSRGQPWSIESREFQAKETRVLRYERSLGSPWCQRVAWGRHSHLERCYIILCRALHNGLSYSECSGKPLKQRVGMTCFVLYKAASAAVWRMTAGGWWEAGNPVRRGFCTSPQVRDTVVLVKSELEWTRPIQTILATRTTSNLNCCIFLVYRIRTLPLSDFTIIWLFFCPNGKWFFDVIHIIIEE
jgi:hypothetical protein